VTLPVPTSFKPSPKAMMRAGRMGLTVLLAPPQAESTANAVIAHRALKV
jgi:hypothetical protein